MMVWDIQFPRGSRSCSSLRNIDHVAVRHDRYNDRVRLGSAIALVGWWRNMQLPPIPFARHQSVVDPVCRYLVHNVVRCNILLMVSYVFRDSN